MSGINRKNNECANMGIVTIAVLIPLVMCKQVRVTGLKAPKAPTPLV